MIQTKVSILSFLGSQFWIRTSDLVRSIAVGGCEYKDPGDAGNLEFDWLEVQLEMFRSRDMKVSAFWFSKRR